MDREKSSLGLDLNVAGLLCYILGWITGIVFLVVEQESRFVKFHALQSIVVFGALTVVYIFIGILQSIFNLIFMGVGVLQALFAGVFSVISIVLFLGGLILWLILMLKAYQGEAFKLPLVGDIAEKQAGW